MYNFKKAIKKISIVCLALLLVFSVACASDTEDAGKATSKPTEKATATAAVTQSAKPSASEKATEAPSDEPTENPEPTEAPKPTVAPEPIPEFSDAMKGKPFEEKYYNSLYVIFEEDFDDDDDWTSEGLAYSQSSLDPSIEIWDEQLCINSLDGEDAGQWARYVLTGVFDFEEYNQIEISMDVMTDGKGCSGTSIGMFTSTYIPDGIRPGSGFWFSPATTKTVAFNGLSSVSKGGWSGGFFSTEAPEDFATMKQLTVVVNEDMITYYMTVESGEKAMIARVVMEDAALVIYNAEGTEIFRGEHDSEKYDWTGTDLSIFSHFCYTTVDNLIIRGY